MHVALLVIWAFDVRKNAATRTTAAALSIVVEGDDGSQEGSVEPGGLGEGRTALTYHLYERLLLSSRPYFSGGAFPFRQW